MMRSLLLIAALTADFASASDGHNWWVGLWKGVDTADGGQITLSITPADKGVDKGGDKVNLRFSDTYIRACTQLPHLLPPGFVGAGSEYNKRGIYFGNTELRNTTDSADFQFDVYCYDQSSKAVPANVTLTNTFQREGNTIIMSNPVLLPLPDGAVRFYRQSTPVMKRGGMYSGVDPLDGGIITLDIGEEDNGHYNLRFSDTFIRACTDKILSKKLPAGFEGAGPLDSKRGIYLANARADGKQLVSLTDGDVSIPIDIFCYSSPTDSLQPKAKFDANVKWTFNWEEDIVIMSGSLFAGETELAGGYRNMRFHHISTGDENNLEDSISLEDSIKITFDNFPQDITWELINTCNGGEVLVSQGGPYEKSLAGKTETGYSGSTSNGSFKFVIKDSFGDGLCCDQGSGGYTIISGREKITNKFEDSALEEQEFGSDLKCKPLPSLASYSSFYYVVPHCGSVNPSGKCTTVGTGLLNAKKSNGEKHGSNTLDSCEDGSSGTYTKDESIEDITITSSEGVLTAGKKAKITATVFAYKDGKADQADFYQAINTGQFNDPPIWQYISSATPSHGGRVIVESKEFPLKAFEVQAVRVVLRWKNGDTDPESCPKGEYTDIDDLVFMVQV